MSSDYPIYDSNTIKDLIDKDVASIRKRRMLDGVNYYAGKNDILNRTITYVVDGIERTDRIRSNNKIVHNYHRLLVDQKTAYLAGKGLKIRTSDEFYTDEISNILGDKWSDTLCELIKNTSNKGQEWLHCFINESGDFDYIICPSEQIIPIYDSSFQNKLINIIRYYSIPIVDSNGRDATRYKVEIWDSEKTMYYFEDNQGNYYFDTSEPLNPKFHYYSFTTSSPDNLTPNFWGKVPFIQFKNNDELTTDLELYKTLIDNYDVNVSDYSNNLADIQDVVWKLVGYQGEDLSEFMNNLKAKKAVAVDAGGDVVPITNEIPYEARQEFLKNINESIYIFGMGVNVSTDKFGNNPSGVALRFLYSLLDLKCDILERKLKVSLKELMWFVTTFINMKFGTSYNYKDTKFVFCRAMITNESEIINNALQSKGIISNETIVENHPWVLDVNEELERMNEDLIENTTMLGGDSIVREDDNRVDENISGSEDKNNSDDNK